MDRREFVSRVTLGAAAFCTAPAPRVLAAPTSSGGLTLRFVGMMGFVGRNDGSFLVATPGSEARGTYSHRPFLMARRGSAAEAALEMRPAIGVNPGAFDMRLSGEQPEDFVYRCLENTSLDIVSGSDARVDNASSQMAQMSKIAPGKRVRGDIERWASATVSLRGGRIADSAAHPDAGKTWSFGQFRQPLTDAVNFESPAGTALRLTTGGEARTLEISAKESTDLWLVSASVPRGGVNNPAVLEHSHVAFDYLSGANAVIAECAEARGRAVPETELPCVHPSSASMGIVAEGARFPPYSELCFMLVIIFGGGKN